MIIFKKNLSSGTPLSIVLIFIGLFAFACSSTDSGSSDEPDGFEDGISEEIREFISDDQLEIIEKELEMPVHRGANPPDIVAMLSPSGKFVSSNMQDITVVMEPLLLLKTNVPNDEGRFGPGTQFADSYFRFRNQNMDNYTIDFDRTSPALDSPYIGEGSFVIGEDNRFTVFGPLESERTDGTSISLNIFSGIITNEGISEPHYTLIMIDDGGVSGVIPNDTGRSFEDGDNLAEVTDWLEQQEKLQNQERNLELLDVDEILY